MFDSTFGTIRMLAVIVIVLVVFLGVGFLFVKVEKIVADDDRAFDAGPGAAVTVLACTATSEVREGAADVTVTCDLEVIVSEGSSYRMRDASTWRLSSYRLEVPLHHLGSFRPGLTLRAKVHSTDPQRFRVLWDDLARISA
jgi:hypothetical protein